MEGRFIQDYDLEMYKRTNATPLLDIVLHIVSWDVDVGTLQNACNRCKAIQDVLIWNQKTP